MSYPEMPPFDGEQYQKYGISEGEKIDLGRRFCYHPPNEDQIRRFHRLTAIASKLGEMVMDFCPDSREKSLALTKLEEGVMWAKAAIARYE